MSDTALFTRKIVSVNARTFTWYQYFSRVHFESIPSTSKPTNDQSLSLSSYSIIADVFNVIPNLIAWRFQYLNLHWFREFLTPCTLCECVTEQIEKMWLRSNSILVTHRHTWLCTIREHSLNSSCLPTRLMHFPSVIRICLNVKTIFHAGFIGWVLCDFILETIKSDNFYSSPWFPADLLNK